MKVGRPCIQLNKEDILELRQLNFSWKKIASILGVSRQTLYRRLEEFDISTDKFSDMSQIDLDELVRDIKKEHPHCGEVMLQGLLIHKESKCLGRSYALQFIMWTMIILFTDDLQL